MTASLACHGHLILRGLKKYAHVHLWTRDQTAGVKSIFCVPAGRAKGNVLADVASRTCNSRSPSFSASFRSQSLLDHDQIGESSQATSPANAITTTLIR